MIRRLDPATIIQPAIDTIIQPPDCFACRHWHGKAHFGLRLVCVPYPNGWQHKHGPCPHYEREARP